ncbi:hypothetical protein K449DRAFT_320412 [Hypoxylon sp. EC38]|nr:hypothetical protein K449DRAFT_320412 [Hypoxylon sp. EC38]
MSGIASAELFKMRIPSPDPKLSGEALAKEVPNDPNRTGTIYADQFLAHKCPPHFDDLQRRQFFCILDLRRLKYAADEIFVKKDWKLNIMNFAKEYEKSRGLIMLRYGLYEFKNVKPSEEVLKRWRATHNLPDPEPESGSTPASRTPVQNNRRTGVPGTSTKRKAEEELAPKDNALMASTANQNKRRNVAQEQVDYTLTGPAPFKKSKRKADETDEPDENQPNKVQKPTPSAAKSKFESILNKAQSGNTSPLKRPPLASFGAQKPNSSAGSVLAGHKVGSMPTKAGNIFSYLSESSANSSGNENGNAGEGETESESEEGDSQEARASEQPSAAGSVGTNTPPTQIDGTLFSSNKPSTQNLFGQANKDLSGQAQASKGGLFGRVQMGSNGQPLRATTDPTTASLFGTPNGTSNTSQTNQGSSGPSFTFTPGGSGQSFNNPFTSSSAQSPAPMFGNGPSTPAPASTSSSSPFPAPSSLGTTPISGTPEPQSQGEDGEEGAQVQISLTATSEEDETILHEVRAKAIKYIPIIKGSDDEDERKSPWSTQGVGTLRVLKHDHTGIVRVLLRAEPRGHVAMNKALLSDIEYKAKDKTVNFIAANDDGSGLETWVLQVKKPDMAQQLAGVLEQHKSANKK